MKIIQNHPDFEPHVLQLLKTQDFYVVRSGDNILSAFGYDPSNLIIEDTAVLWAAVFGFTAGSILFLSSFLYWHRKSGLRIQALTAYLEKINTDGQGLLLDSREDEFSILQDEIYKTATTLYQTRDAALAAKKNLRRTSQLKTPITSISLTVQMAEDDLGNTRTAQIKRQISRLMHLEEALLLSRIDAGTLTLDRKPADVFTLLSLASDNLYELFARKGISMDIPETDGIQIYVDLDWTMEAVMNLMKNCMEAAKTGTTVRCSYEKNPLYVQIRIWDEGEGFAKEDLPHLFERFYRGRKTDSNGIGIGLSLAKAVIEMQNGVIRGFNLPNGGACFEIRFYA